MLRRKQIHTDTDADILVASKKFKINKQYAQKGGKGFKGLSLLVVMGSNLLII